MGRSNSFSKRQLEKRRAKRRKEKKERREERRAQGASSFEDMIAYVDEHGVITDTPPDPATVEKIDVEEIEISTPKMDEVEEKPLSGRVEHFNHDKGYGFIKDLDSVEKYFFHISNAFDDIQEGDIVTFELEHGQRGLNAVSVVMKE